MKVSLENNSGKIKHVPVGFSWTLFFFGPLVPIIRGDILYCIITAIASCCTFGLSWLVFPFIYNKLYTKKLIKKGYKPADDFSAGLLQRKGIQFERNKAANKNSQSAATNMDITDELVKLSELKNKGIITAEEFEKQKQNLLKKK